MQRVWIQEPEEKLPVTVNTLFPIGSCTKSFTVSLIGSLAAKGEIDINKPVRDYLPDLKFFNDEMNDRITIRDMMCHRTGLPRHDYSGIYFRQIPRQPAHAYQIPGAECARRRKMAV